MGVSKRTIFVALILVFFTMPFVLASNAEGSMTVEEVKTKIASILAEVQKLQSLLNQLRASEGGFSRLPSDYSFNANLSLKSYSQDVQYLQILLNQDADTKVSDAGWGSAGQESMYFGVKTQDAVIRFKQKYNIGYATGYVGPLTREKLNELLGKYKSGEVRPTNPSYSNGSSHADSPVSECKSGDNMCPEGCTYLKDKDCTYCGDGKIQKPNDEGTYEVCDASDLNSNSCATKGYLSGTLSCSDDCSFFNTSNCLSIIPGGGSSYTSTITSSEPECGLNDGICPSGCTRLKDADCTYCGDNIVQTPNNEGGQEVCDGTNLNNQTCNTKFGEDWTGSLSCSSDCLIYVTSACTPPPPPNNVPVLNNIPDTTGTEGQNLMFAVSAADEDDDTLFYSVQNIPSGASFENRTFNWTPSYNQAGIYVITFVVSDGEDTDQQDVTVTVYNINRAPVLASIGSKTVSENNILSFTVSATDLDNDILYYSTQNRPQGSTFNSATRTFTWVPDYSQSGTYTMTFIVSDGEIADSETITITVQNVCIPTTCEIQGKNCGTISDNCGGTLSCGSCSAGYTCTENVCVQNPLIPSPSCPSTDISCGVYPSCSNCNSQDGCVVTTYRDYYCQNNACTYTSIPDDPRCTSYCVSGQTRSCSTGLEGVCSTGTQSCQASGTWGSCVQSTEASSEVCDDSSDNDCDGLSDCYDSDCSSYSSCQTYGIPQDYISFWKFEDNANDEEGLNSGVINGDPVFAAGIDGNALNFDGTGDYVQLSDINIGTNDFSIFAWAKAGLSQVAGFPGILGAGLSGSGYLLPFYINDSGYLRTGIDGSGYSSGTTDIRDNAWHLVGISADRSDKAHFYIDEDEDGTGVDISAKVAASLLASAPRIGENHYGGGAYFFTGLIDELILYNRSLSSSEAQDIYDYYTISSCPGSDTSCGVYPSCNNCNLLDGCYSSQSRDYYCDSTSCSYTDVAEEESTANSNCSDGIDNDCDGDTDVSDSGCSYYYLADYYVDGSILSDCATYDPYARTCGSGGKQAYDTVQEAADVAAAGDTVAIRGGTYSGRLVPADSGTAGNYITYMAYPGESAVLDGTSVDLEINEGLVHIASKSYIKISGLTIQNVYNNIDQYEKVHGVRITLADNIVIEDNYIYNTCGPGVQTGGSSNITVDNNEFELNCHDCRGEIVSIASTDTFEVKNNYIHDGGLGYGRYSFGGDGGEGIDAKEGSANGKIYNNIIHTLIEDMGVYLDTYGATQNIEVYNNKVYDSREGFALGAETAVGIDNISFHHNIAYNNEKYGINICGYGDGDRTNISVLNNVVYNNQIGGIYSCTRNYSNIIVKNNIASQNADYQILVPEGMLSYFTISNNLIDGFRGYIDEISGSDYSNVSGSPNFVSAAGADFQLQSGSPAINAGVDVSLISDFLGNTIPYSGTLPDIGAYEYGY